nr:hypothetical protein SHINE37_44539 [Rhizobiaceae bacterium]
MVSRHRARATRLARGRKAAAGSAASFSDADARRLQPGAALAGNRRPRLARRGRGGLVGIDVAMDDAPLEILVVEPHAILGFAMVGRQDADDPARPRARCRAGQAGLQNDMVADGMGFPAHDLLLRGYGNKKAGRDPDLFPSFERSAASTSVVGGQNDNLMRREGCRPNSCRTCGRGQFRS